MGGSASCYPRVILLQAAVLAGLLKRAGKRNFDEAAWDLWVLGFPVTEYVRELLRDELDEQLRVHRYAKEHPRAVKQELKAKRRSRELKEFLKIIRVDHLPRLVELFADMQLGRLSKRKYKEKDWRLAQEAVIGRFLPQYLDHEDLPPADEVGEGLRQHAREMSLPKTIAALDRVDTWWLEALRNEAQWFVEWMAGPAADPGDALLPREGFLDYFKRAHVSLSGRRKAVVSRRALGWRRPPPSPLERVLSRVQSASTSET